MAEAQESRLSIVIDSADAEKRIKELRKQLRELGQQSDETGDNTDDLGRRQRRASDDAGNLGSANDKAKKSLDSMAKAAALAGAALAGAIGLSINKAQSWETAMSEINKTVDFAAEDGLANMRKGLQELTTQIPQTFEELAAVTATGGQLGIAEENLLGFTETMAKMGVAFDIPAQQAADSMAKIANVFQIPIENIDRLGDAINTLSNNTPATAAQLIDSLQRVGGVAKVFGLSEDATLGLTGALIAMGKPAEVASTAVNSLLTTFSTLDNATKSQIKGFEKLGLDIDEFSKLVATDGKQAIITYLEAINKLDQSERIGTNAMIIGKEFGDDLTMLAGSVGVLENNWAMLGETVNTTKDYFGSMDVEFEKISATSANKMVLFKNNIDGVVASVGDAFIPALNELLLNMTPMVATIGTWVAANPELIQQITLIGGALLGSIVGLKLAVDGFMAVKGTIEGLQAAFTVVIPAIKSAFAVLTGSIGLPLLAIGALIAAGVLLYQNWDTVKEKASELNEWIKVKFGSLPEPLQQAGRDIAEVFMFIWNTGKEYLTLMSELYSGIFESFKTIATGAFQVVWSIIKVSFSGIVNTISTALQLVATLFSSGFALIKNTVSTVLDVIKAVISGDFKAIPGIIGNGLKTAASIVTNMMGNILNIIKEYGKKLYSIGKDFIQGFINGIKSVGSGVASAASTMVGNAIAAVKKRQDSASPSKVTTKLGGDFAKGMENGIKKGAKAVKTEAQKMAEQAVAAVKTGVENLKREIALFGNDSPVAALKYDISVGKFGGADASQLMSLTQTKEQLELSKKLADANKSVQDSIDGLIKQQALFGNNSSLASLMYDIEHTEKYKGVTQELTDKLIEQTRALEQLGMTAKATDAIRARFAQLEKDKEKSGDALLGVMGEIKEETPLGKIQADYESRLAKVEEYERLHTDMLENAKIARLAIEQSYMDAKQQIMLGQGEALFGNLAGLSKAFLGEQSSLYRGLFAIEKGYTLASVLLKNKEAISKAWASAPFPYNLAAVASTVAGTAGLASAVSGIMPKGFKQGGYTGNMGASQVAGVVHGQEYVFDAQATKRIGVDNLNAMRSGKSVGGDVQVNIINNSSARVTASDDGQTITIEDVRNENKRSWTNLSNPNSFESKQVNRNIQAPRRR
ncbi:phage tail tape measure protein [Psychrobacter faecalis]|uniref:phage tail tape measure protein n=1 Tax=Psychrobacter faecalis TaxID=180588 RepID=UPI003FD48A06